MFGKIKTADKCKISGVDICNSRTGSDIYINFSCEIGKESMDILIKTMKDINTFNRDILGFNPEFLKGIIKI